MGTNGVVRAVLLQGRTAYAGGEFASVTGTNGTFSRSNLAAWNLETGEVVTSFTANADGAVRALAARGSSLFVGGDFRTVNGQTRGRLAEIDANTGAVRAGFRNNANGAVRALAIGGGRLFVGGSFGAINSATRSRLAAIDLVTGTLVSDFAPTTDGPVFALAATASGDRVYAGGTFLTINGQATPYLAGLDSAGQSVLPAFPLTTTYNVLALDINEDGSRLFAAHGGSGNQAAAYSTATGARLWRQRADGDVQSIAYHAGNVYFGFHESFALDVSLRLLVADARTGTLENALRPSVNSYMGIHALDATDVGLLAGGEFTRIAEVAAGRVAFFDASKGPMAPTTLVAASSTWRYFDGPANPGGWQAAGFDDFGWREGAAEFGYGDGDEVTVIGYGGAANRKYLTSYYRTSFEWDGAAPFATLSVSLLADDGAAVYLNGQEVVRDNLPPGALIFSTRALADRAGADETTRRTFTVAASALRAGTNTIAVELHQVGPASSDISFDLTLKGNAA